MGPLNNELCSFCDGIVLRIYDKIPTIQCICHIHTHNIQPLCIACLYEITLKMKQVQSCL